MNPDPFSKYKLNKLQEPVQSPSVENIKNSNDVFSKYKLTEQNSEEESLPQYITRNAIRLGSRAAETIGGLPGDIADLIQSGVFSGLESLVGQPVTEKARKEAKEFSESPPSSSSLKKTSEEFSKGYTSPKNALEKTADEYAETVASLLGPMKFRKALGIAAVGSTAKKSLELAGLGEGAQEAAKLGTMLIASMVNPNGVKKYYTNLYKHAESLVPEGTMVSAKPLENKLLNLKKNIEKGTIDRFDSKVLEQTDKVLSKIKDGKVDVSEMIASNRSINGVAGDPEFYRRGEHLFPKLQNAVRETVKLHKDPKMLKSWYQANQAFSGMAQSQKLSKFFLRHLGDKPIHKLLITSLGEAVAGYPEAIGPTLGLAGGAFLGVKGIELMKRIMTNPTLRGYYGDVIKEGLKQNSKSMIQAAEKLEKSLSKD